MKATTCLLIYILLSINTYCQQIQWIRIDSVEEIKSLHNVNGDLLMLGFDDTCFTNNPTLVNIDPQTGIRNNAIIFGDRWCSSNFNAEIRDNFRYGDTILYSLRILDSINNFYDVILQRLPNATIDTVYTTNIGIWKVNAFNNERILGIDNNRVFLSDNLGNVLAQYSSPGTGWTQLAASTFNQKYYAFNVQNPVTNNNAIVAVCFDADLTPLASDTIDPGPGTERVEQVIPNANNSKLYLINSSISMERITVCELDSLGRFGLSILLSNYRYVNTAINNSSSELYLCAVHTPTQDLTLFKFDLTNFSLVDSVVVDAMAQSNRVQMDIAADNSIYITDKSNTSVVEVYGINNGLQIFGSLQIVDSTANFNTIGGISAGVNGKLWAAYSGGFMQGSLLFHVDFGALSVSEHTASCISKYQITQNEFYSDAQLGCKPVQIQITDLTGRTVFEAMQPSQFAFIPKSTGIYIIQVLFENGEVKREKVFLTAN